jgi:hypothetical protein
VNLFYPRMRWARQPFRHRECFGALVCARRWRASPISKVVVSIRWRDWDTNDFALSRILHAVSMVISLRDFAVSPIPLTFFTFQYLIEFRYNFN